MSSKKHPRWFLITYRNEKNRRRIRLVGAIDQAIAVSGVDNVEHVKPCRSYRIAKTLYDTYPELHTA